MTTDLLDIDMEATDVAGTSLRVSRVALGTWAIGGWMWGGTDDAKSVATIREALEQGINIIDTAPVYGFGHSEEIVRQGPCGGQAAFARGDCQQGGAGMAGRAGIPQLKP